MHRLIALRKDSVGPSPSPASRRASFHSSVFSSSNLLTALT